MSLIGTLIGGGAQLGSGLRQKQTDEDTARKQKEIGEYQAQDEINTSTIEQMRYRRQVNALMGAQKNEIGARNVEARGSALDLLEDSAQIGEEDLTTIRNNAARQAWGYRTNANEQARVTRQSGRNAAAQGIGSALTSGSQAYGQWADK